MARTESQRAIPLALIAIVVALLIARVVVARIDAQKRGGGDDLVQWVPLEEAETIARGNGKPILYDFTAEWCGPCHQLKDAVFRDEKLAAMINDRFVPVRVVDRQREEGSNPPLVSALQQRYAVNGFPTIVVVDAYGTARERMEGFRGPAPFEQMMERFR